MENVPCQKEKNAWMTHTNARTIARAKFAGDGGRPRGLYAIKTKTEAVNNIAPKSPNRYDNVFISHREGGGVGTFGPTSFNVRAALSFDRPCEGELPKRVKISFVDTKW